MAWRLYAVPMLVFPQIPHRFGGVPPCLRPNLPFDRFFCSFYFFLGIQLLQRKNRPIATARGAWKKSHLHCDHGGDPDHTDRLYLSWRHSFAHSTTAGKRAFGDTLAGTFGIPCRRFAKGVFAAFSQAVGVLKAL